MKPHKTRTPRSALLLTMAMSGVIIFAVLSIVTRPELSIIGNSSKSLGVPEVVARAGDINQSSHVQSGMGISVYTYERSNPDGSFTYQTTNCSLGPILDKKTALTAGHCIKGQDAAIIDPRNNVVIGHVRQSQHGDGLDAAIIDITNNIKNEDITVDEQANTLPKAGETITKTGQRTGTTTGTTDGAIVNDLVAGRIIHAHRAHLCALPGDSGGVVRNAAGQAIGITSYYTANDMQEPPTHCSENISFGYVSIEDSLNGLM